MVNRMIGPQLRPLLTLTGVRGGRLPGPPPPDLAGVGRVAALVPVFPVVFVADGDALRAVYFDNEGHVIHYHVAVVESDNAIQFLSPASADQPGFRLTYIPTGPATLRLLFEIAPLGTASLFSPYIEAQARRS